MIHYFPFVLESYSILNFFNIFLREDKLKVSSSHNKTLLQLHLLKFELLIVSKLEFSLGVVFAVILLLNDIEISFKIISCFSFVLNDTFLSINLPTAK